MRKRLLSILLCLCMIVGMLPATVLATDSDEAGPLAEGVLPGARSGCNSTTGDVFLGGNYIEVGISRHGSFGTEASPSASGITGFHPYGSSSGIGLRVDGDGWNVGTPSNTGDFFLPGNPEERWIIAYYIDGEKREAPIADRNSVTSSAMWSTAPEVTDTSDISEGILSAVVSGVTKDNVKVDITYSFGVDDKYFTTDVRIENNSGKDISKVRFVRSFDPDMDAETKGTYETYNKVICNPKDNDSLTEGGADNFAMVVARGGKSLEGFFFIAMDERARASWDEPLAPENGAYDDILWDDAPITSYTYATTDELDMKPAETNGGYTLEDGLIALTFEIATLSNGQSTELQYISSLDPNVIESLNNILGKIDYEKETLTGLTAGHTYKITAGSDTYIVTADDKGEIPLFVNNENGPSYDLMGKSIVVVEVNESGESVSEPQQIEIASRPEAVDPVAPGDSTDIYNKPEEVQQSNITTDVDSITVVHKNTPVQEYTIDGDNWETPVNGIVAFEGLDSKEEYTIITRIPASISAPASLPTNGITVKPLGKIDVTEPALSPIPFDGESHSAEITVTDSVSGASIKYAAASGDTYDLTNPPAYTNVGEYKYYYRVTANGYRPVYGDVDLKIVESTIENKTGAGNINHYKNAVLNIANMIPDDAGNVTLDVTRSDSSNLFDITHSAGQIVIKNKDNIKSDICGKVQTIEITVKSDNYNDYKVTLSVTPRYVSSETTINVPVSNNENKVNVSATVSGNDAVIKPLNTNQLEQIIGDENSAGDVVVDLSGLNKNVDAVSIPKESLEAIVDAAEKTDNDTEHLVIKLSTAELKIDDVAMRSIVEQSEGNLIKFNFDDVGTSRLNSKQKESVKEMDIRKGYEAYITVNGTRVSDFKGGNVEIIVPYEMPKGHKASGFSVWYIDEDGTLEKQKSTYDGKKKCFVVSHFSDYVIAYDENAADVANCPKDDTCPIWPFEDASCGEWYHDGVHYCIEEGLMNGVADKQFAPFANTSRAMIATILWRMENQPSVNYEMTFTDVEDGAWYADAVRWAQSVGVVEGYDEESFGPDDMITREQMAAILWRYCNYKGIDVSVGEDTNILSYEDAFDISEWATDAMQWACGAGLIQGIEKGDTMNLDPQGSAVRCQSATILFRFLETVRA